MTGKKRSSKVISPIQKGASKSLRTTEPTNNTVMANDKVTEDISNLTRKIEEITAKENPSNRDLIMMISFTSQRDALRYEKQIIPSVVAALLDKELTSAMAEGESLRRAIIHAVQDETSEVNKKEPFLRPVSLHILFHKCSTASNGLGGQI